MAKITLFKLNRNHNSSQSVEKPPTVAERLARLREQLQAVERLEKNVNARLLAEVLLLDWPHG